LQFQQSLYGEIEAYAMDLVAAPGRPKKPKSA